MRWNKKGSGLYDYIYPTCIAADSLGNVYVGDIYNGIEKFTSQGEFISQWPGYGKDITVDWQGNVYVVDSLNVRIQKFASQGGFILEWGGPLVKYWDIAIDKQENVYVVGSNGIQKFSSQGQFISEWTSKKNTRVLAIDKQDNVYIDDNINRKILKYTSEGEFILEWGIVEFPIDVTIDNQDNVYISLCINNEYRIQKFTTEGELILDWNINPYSSVSGIAVDSQGNVYIGVLGVSVENGWYHSPKILKYTSEGKLILEWSRASGVDPFWWSLDIAVVSQDNVYALVITSGGYLIQKFSSQGEFILEWGYGQLRSPRGLKIYDQTDFNIYVLDNTYSYSHSWISSRILKFQSPLFWAYEYVGFNESPTPVTHPITAVPINRTNNEQPSPVYKHMDEFESRYHYLMDMTFEKDDILDPRQHLNYSLRSRRFDIMESDVDSGQSLSISPASEPDIDEAMLSTNTGDIIINAGKRVTITAGVGSIFGDIEIIAGSDLLISDIVSTSETDGTISFATGGLISSALPVIAHTLNLNAGTGITLATKVFQVTAIVTKGPLELYEKNEIILVDIVNYDGYILIRARSTITAKHVESQNDILGNNVMLMASNGDIFVDYVAAGRNNGQVTLNAKNNISEVEPEDSDVDVRCKIAILTAVGAINTPRALEFDTTNSYMSGSGNPMKINYRAGDIELMLTTNQDVDIKANGNIRVVYLDSQGHNVKLESTNGEVILERLTSGPVSGNLTVISSKDIRLQESSFSGTPGKLSFAGEITLKSKNGQVNLAGDITAGKSITINSAQAVISNGIFTAAGDMSIKSSGADININGEVHGSKNIVFNARKDVLVNAAVSGENLDIKSDDGQVFLSGIFNLLGRSNILGYAAVVLNAKIYAIGTINVESKRSTVSINNDLESGDDVNIRAQGDITISAAVFAHDDATIISSNGRIAITGSVVAGDKKNLRSAK